MICVATAFTWQSAAAQTDVIRGKVTGVDGTPLVGVQVTATSIPGNVTRPATTSTSGSYQIAFPGGAGDYIMSFSMVGYTTKQFEIKRLADEQVLVADTRMAPLEMDAIVVVAPVQQRVNRFDVTPDVGGTQKFIPQNDLPADQQGNFAAMAASLPGVLLLPGLDGEPDAFSVLGLGADQNSTTLNGLATDANGLPRDAGLSTSLTTSPYDPSRGGFSGANLNVNSRAGSNFQTRGMSLVVTTPQLQWTDRAARALGNDYTNLSLGGMASGPLELNKWFYNVSYQLGRQSRENNTLLTTSALGLQTAGIAIDSVNRFVGILGERGIPTRGGPERASRLSDNGSVFGSIDLQPPFSATGQSYNLTFNGNWRRNTPVSSGALQLASAGGDQTSWSGGLQGKHSGYFGLILSETSAGINLSKDYGDPYLNLPGGRVRVNSIFDDGESALQNLAFGGNQGLGSTSRSVSGTFQNNLSWFDDANKHRLKLTTEVNYSGSDQFQSQNLLGTFTFNSLADLAAGRPAAFTRTLSARDLSTGQFTGSLAIGDSYRYSQDLQFQYGLRLDGSKYANTPDYNALVESTFDRRNDNVPNPIAISPRLGFSWTVGTAPEISAFSGAVRAPRAVVRGGIGIFANGANAGQIGNAISNTGLASGIQQINCVGPAVPVPDWNLYATDPGAIPEVCADGTAGTVFSNSAPNVSLFADNFAPQKSIRSNLSWSGSALDGRFSLGVDGAYSLNRNQQRSFDLNFNPLSRFNLTDDGRPVFVNTSSIVPASGSIASSDARMSQAFARVTETRSDLESRTAQMTLRLSPIPRTPTKFGWSASYTFINTREQVSGFSSTAGNPLDVSWANSAQGPHSINYTLRYLFFNAVQVSWNGSFRSGSAFTPVVAGDINGDGYSNDRAFIYGAGSGDAAVRAGMASLLESSTGGTRECLEKQAGEIAERNSCSGPWSSTASLNVTLDRAKFHMPQRAQLSFSLSNPLGGADLLLNGSGKLKGWGQTPSPDQSLLYVRGFDPVTKQYKYEVNQRFGATRPQFVTLRSPVMLTASLKFDLGPTREQQSLSQQLMSGRSQSGSQFPEQFFRQVSVNSVQNPMGTILRSMDSLRLNTIQADSIASMNRRYTYRADSLWTPTAKYLAALPKDFDKGEAYKQYLSARHRQIDMLMDVAAAVRGILTSAQMRKLPSNVINMLDPRYLTLIRSGTGMYVGGTGVSSFGGGGFEGAMVTEMVMAAGGGIRIGH
ncbi:MAG: carboxypeptidase-like regulatory domain-containing protein [Longimicrobiales bacterium]